MRAICLATLIGLTAYSSADRLISAPTALKILNRTARIEHLFEPSRPDNARTYLGVGLTKDVEAEFLLDQREGRSRLGTFNFSYQFLIPIVDTAPGIAFGVQDVMDRTPERRMYYLAFTERFGLDGPYNSNSPLEITAGFGFGRRSGVFVGMSLPFTWQFRLLAEHDLRRVAGGFEYRPFTGAAVRAIFQQGQTQLGLRYTLKF